MTRFSFIFACALCLLIACFLTTGCAGNALARENLERAWTVREQDKRVVIPDATYNAMPVEQRRFFLPQSLDDAAHFERDNALKLAE